MEPITIAVCAGTTRERRLSIHAARYVAEAGRQLPGVEILFVDPKEFSFAGDGNDVESKDPRYSDITARADAFFIITPEYNHSFPGSLKRMLDSEFANYLHKPVALAGVSNGSWGGVRACEALLPVCHRLGLVNIQPELYFPRVQDIFQEDGQMRDEYVGRYQENIGRSYAELVWFARLLKAGRMKSARPRD
jgi:NAD(P)H-dependent FMN reductase